MVVRACRSPLTWPIIVGRAPERRQREYHRRVGRRESCGSRPSLSQPADDLGVAGVALVIASVRVKGLDVTLDNGLDVRLNLLALDGLASRRYFLKLISAAFDGALLLMVLPLFQDTPLAVGGQGCLCRGKSSIERFLSRPVGLRVVGERIQCLKHPYVLDPVPFHQSGNVHRMVFSSFRIAVQRIDADFAV